MQMAPCCSLTYFLYRKTYNHTKIFFGLLSILMQSAEKGVFICEHGLVLALHFYL